MELIFEIRDAEEGGFYARALGHAIFTEADTWEDLRAEILEAVSLHFDDAPGGNGTDASPAQGMLFQN